MREETLGVHQKLGPAQKEAKDLIQTGEICDAKDHQHIQYWDLINKWEDPMENPLLTDESRLNEQGEVRTSPVPKMVDAEETKIIRTDHRGFGS